MMKPAPEQCLHQASSYRYVMRTTPLYFEGCTIIVAAASNRLSADVKNLISFVQEVESGRECGLIYVSQSKFNPT